MSSSADEQDFVEPPPRGDVCRRTFILTYSQADLQRFPDCASFARLIQRAFASVKSSREIREWACCKEEHQDGGSHYHMALNLSGTRRWNPIRRHIYENHGVAVNFSTNSSGGYVTAYRYVLKDKPFGEVLHSEGHTPLQGISSPKTAVAIKRNSKGPSQKTQNVAKKRRLSNKDVAKFMVTENIKNEQQLYVVAQQRNGVGESDLYNFILGKNPKALSDLVNTTWKLEQAPAALERDKNKISNY